MDYAEMTGEELTQIPCIILRKLPDETIQAVAKKVAAFYRSKGFPYYELTDEEKAKVMQKMQEFSVDRLDLGGGELQQAMLGLNLANYYHPQMWEARYKKSKTPMEIFQDEELFTKALYKRIKLSETKLQPFNIRKSLKIFGGYSVSNFRPTIAKFIYEKYCPAGGSTLDPSSGYSGRLLGAWASSTVSEYWGVDPDLRQIFGGDNMLADLYKLGQRQSPFSANFIGLPFEDAIFPRDRQFDLVFTSPPYFNVERYSDDPTQSWVRYSEYDAWVECFLNPLIEKSFAVLKDGGYMAINIAGAPLIRDLTNHATKVFSSIAEIKYMRLSKLLGGKTTESRFKLEGIYIWKKTLAKS